MALTEQNRAAIDHARRLAGAGGGAGVGWAWAGLPEQVGPVSVPFRAGPDGRFRMLRGAVAEHLPKAWAGKIHALARAARASVAKWEGDRAAGDVYAHWLQRYAGADGADLSEDGVRDRAETIAARAQALHFAPGPEPWGALRALDRVIEFAAGYGGTIKPTKALYSLQSWVARVCCVRWWRRVLRRWVAQQYETGAIELGAVGANAGQWYCSDRAVKRRMQQVRANEAAMRAAVVQSESGQKMTLWDVAQTTVSNKAIRRGELMTRIKGCEQWADAQGLAGLFTTNTCPSRFHSQRKGGGANPAYDGSTPADAQRWLCTQWARLRAKLARDGLPIVGFRVAEPHHDGCPHWHMLIWCATENVARVSELMREYWLKDCGEEPGAQQYRVAIKAMQSGMAAGYIAKYIAKNIDDAHIDKHGDEWANGLTVGPDLLGDMEVKPCARVEAWASLWRIRQFQAIGQPPVTVWRELRRVPEQAAAAGSDAMVRAWLSVHREGARLANWHGYMQAQGGAMLARTDYRFCVRRLERDKAGRYETVREKWACGVLDSQQREATAVAPTRRERWGADGFAAQRRAVPWTRFNNCTRHNRAGVGKVAGELAELCRMGEAGPHDGLQIGPEAPGWAQDAARLDHVACVQYDDWL